MDVVHCPIMKCSKYTPWFDPRHWVDSLHVTPMKRIDTYIECGYVVPRDTELQVSCASHNEIYHVGDISKITEQEASTHTHTRMHAHTHARTHTHTHTHTHTYTKGLQYYVCVYADTGTGAV